MSIGSQIDRINQNIANTYSVLESAGATMPAEANSDNLAATAQSISAVLYGKSQTLTEAQKAQARANIGAVTQADIDMAIANSGGGGGGTTSEYETVDSVEEMTDTSKQYVMSSTGTLWAYGETEVDDTDRNMLDKTAEGFTTNLRLNGTTSQPGALCTNYIPTNVNWTDPYQYQITVRGRGAKIDTTIVYPRIYKFQYYDENKNTVGNEIWPQTVHHTQVDDTTLHLWIGTNLDGTGAHSLIGTNYVKIAYTRIWFTFTDGASLTDAMIPSDLAITTPEPKTKVVSAWYDTGVAPSSGGSSGGSMNYTELLVKINTVDTQVSALDDRVTAIEENGVASAGKIALASYVEPLISNIALAAKAHMKSDSVSFVYFTDTHYTSADTCYPTLIARKLAEAVNATAIIHGGDLAHLYGDGKAAGLEIFQRHSVILQGCNIPYFQVVGNHDDGNGYLRTVALNYSAENYIKAEDLFFATTQQSRRDVSELGSKKGYYYIDDEDSKTRFIVLNSHDYPWEVNTDGTLKYDSHAGGNVANTHGIKAIYSPEQLEWLANVALDFSGKSSPESWSVLALAHMGTYNWANINTLFKAFHNGTKYTKFAYADAYGIHDYSDITITTDFSQFGPRKIAFLLGDAHWDSSADYEYPAIVVLNASPAKDQTTAPTKTAGTPTETALSVFVVTPSEGKITEVRFGAGTNTAGNYNPTLDYDNYRVFEF